MLTEKEILDAVIAETDLPPAQAEEIVHSVMDSVLREVETGEPVVNFETGTVDLMIEKETLLRSLVDKAHVTATEAQPALEAILELIVRL